jgi:hypothetical protein
MVAAVGLAVLVALAVLVPAGTVAVANRRPDGGADAGPATSAGVPRLDLRRAEEGRAELHFTVVAGNLDRTIARVAAILDGDPKIVRAFTLAILKIPEPFVDALRTDAPVAAVLVQGPIPGGEPVAVIAAAVKPTHVAALLQTAGKVKRRDGDAVEVELAVTPPRQVSPFGHPGVQFTLPGTPPRRLWLLVRDQVVLMAASQEALIAGRALALAARTPTAERDVVVTAHPKALAHVSGVASASLELWIDPARDSSARIRLHPEPGHALARAAAPGDPYVADPAAMNSEPAAAAAPPAFVGATGRLPIVTEARKMLTAAPTGAGSGASARRWAALVDELASKLTGAWTIRGDLAVDGFAYQCAYRLAPGVKPARVMDLVARLATEKTTSELLELLDLAPAASAPEVTRRNDRLHVRIPLATKRSPSGRALVAPGSLAAMDYLDLAFAVAAGRLLMASGPDAAVLIDGLAREAVAPSRTDAPRLIPPAESEVRARAILNRALAESKGADAVLYVDAGPFLKTWTLSWAASRGGAVVRSTVPLADELGAPTPLSFALRGEHDALSIDVRMPIETVRRIGPILSSFGDLPDAPPAGK